MSAGFSGDRERLARQFELIRRSRSATEKSNISQLPDEYRVDRRTIRRELRDLVVRGQLSESARGTVAE